MPKKISTETQAEAMKIAKGTQKTGQSKEQTKLIAHGIEKGIAEYKKQQKVKARERDKVRKKEIAAKDNAEADVEVIEPKTSKLNSSIPWVLLVISWLGFAGYVWFTGAAL